MTTQREKDIEASYKHSHPNMLAGDEIFADGAAYGRKDVAKRLRTLIGEGFDMSLDELLDAIRDLCTRLEGGDWGLSTDDPRFAPSRSGE